MTRFLLASLEFYRRWLSPALHRFGSSHCKYVPTCSQYASAAISMHGAWRGLALSAWRLLRCHPFARGGLDQVPPAPAARPFAHKPLP